MTYDPDPARAVYAKRGHRDPSHGDTVAARAWDALLSCLLTAHPGMTVPDALRDGVLTAQELSAAHAWAARTNTRRLT